MFTAKPGDIIRHKITRHPYLVIAKSPQGYMVVDLFDDIDPAIVSVILPRAAGNFEPDFVMIDMNEPEAKALKKKLPIVEAVQQSLLKENG